MIKLNGILISLIALAISAVLSWYYTAGPISCSVFDAGLSHLNGYYEVMGGRYLKKGFDLYFNPDIFTILNMKRTIDGRFAIGMARTSWFIADATKNQIVYANNPEDPSKYIHHPPKGGWKALKEEYKPEAIVSHCMGNLDDEPAAANHSSNIQQIFDRPVTSTILLLICIIAYYLWELRVDVSSVAYSYDAVVNRGEYWRFVTASLSHFDLMHLGFNAMSFWQLGMVEPLIGSARFLYLNIALVVLTMLIVTGVEHVLITRYNRVELIQQQAVGYSCVLFAWMVVMASWLTKYCPIFLFPDLCVNTWFLPIPTSLGAALNMVKGFPVNLGPFLLLVLTKLFIPRSSFLGHLAGIIIGYPLSWNMLNWLTPPILCGSLLLAYIVADGAFIWRFPGFNTTHLEIEPLFEEDQTALRHYKICHILAYFIIVGVPVNVYYLGVEQIVPRATFAFLCWSAVQACRCERAIGSGGGGASKGEICARVMFLSVVFATFMIIYDVCNLTATWNASEMIFMNLTSAAMDNYVRINFQHLVFMLMLEVLHVVLFLTLLMDAKSAVRMLVQWRCDAQGLVNDMKLLSLPCDWVSGCCTRCVEAVVGRQSAFTGTTGYRLVSTSESSNQLEMSSSSIHGPGSSETRV